MNSEEIVLDELVAENIALFSRMAEEKNITLKSDLSIDTVLSDRHILSTVIRNLVDNAIKYTPVDGTVSILASEEAGKISLSVQDNGVGMTDDQISKLFTLNKAKSTKVYQGHHWRRWNWIRDASCAPTGRKDRWGYRGFFSNRYWFYL